MIVVYVDFICSASYGKKLLKVISDALISYHALVCITQYRKRNNKYIKLMMIIMYLI
jgi:hypothetical protein